MLDDLKTQEEETQSIDQTKEKKLVQLTDEQKDAMAERFIDSFLFKKQKDYRDAGRSPDSRKQSLDLQNFLTNIFKLYFTLCFVKILKFLFCVTC